ncbi:MAG: ATP-binding cassette domain-containing protein, partial [Agrobacterium tumefaciens]
MSASSFLVASLGAEVAIPTDIRQHIALPNEHVGQERRAVDAAKELVLELRGIDLSFGGVVALENIDLAVQQGEILGIIGPNGAGKSSLINVI